MNNAQLINNIKLICKQKSIPLGTMLESCNLSKGFIYDVEKRDRTPSIDKISAISEYLGVSVDYLLGRSEEPQRNIITNSGKVEISGTQANVISNQQNLDEMEIELVKRFKTLSFDKKLDVFNYIKSQND